MNSNENNFKNEMLMKMSDQFNKWQDEEKNIVPDPENEYKKDKAFIEKQVKELSYNLQIYHKTK